MTADIIETLNGAVIQHGKSSDRVYVMKLEGNANRLAIIKQIETLADAKDYGKLFVKVPISDEPLFTEAGYRREGFVSKLFHGTTDGVFLCRYKKNERMHDPHAERIADVIKVARTKADQALALDAPPYQISEASESDASELAQLYKTVFASYPFPIFEPNYLVATMRDHIAYFIARNADNQLVAAASLEMDKHAGNAEMTDFAARPECRGQSIAAHLLSAMERKAPQFGIKTLFTIARAMSYGMNATFGRLGYTFGGTLINNTQISGDIESMNIWYKPANVN